MKKNFVTGTFTPYHSRYIDTLKQNGAMSIFHLNRRDKWENFFISIIQRSLVCSSTRKQELKEKLNSWKYKMPPENRTIISFFCLLYYILVHAKNTILRKELDVIKWYSFLNRNRCSRWFCCNFFQVLFHAFSLSSWFYKNYFGSCHFHFTP